VSLAYLALVTLNACTLLSLVAGIDGPAVQQRLTGAVPERFAGGVLTGLGALFFLRAIGLLVFFVLQPFLTATPFPLADFVVIFVMGLVCFIPFALFVRGVASKGNTDKKGK